MAKALSFALVQLAQHADAAAVLTEPPPVSKDHELAHNLARLLATTPDPAVRDGATALRLASAVRDRTGGRDPRVLDTLAAAYAAEGQFDLARETARQAAALATELGQADEALEIERHARDASDRASPLPQRTVLARVTPNAVQTSTRATDRIAATREAARSTREGRDEAGRAERLVRGFRFAELGERPVLVVEKPVGPAIPPTNSAEPVHK